MKTRQLRLGLVPALAQILLLRCAKAATDAMAGCLELSGIVSGGGDGMLDWDVVSITAAQEPFHPSIPVLPTVAKCSDELEAPVSMRNLLGLDTAAFSVAMMFHPNGIALDVFGDKVKSSARRRCYPDENTATVEEVDLFDLHLRVAILYLVSYGGIKGMPFCREQVETAMRGLGLPLDMVEGEADTTTPWGLAKAYVDETYAYLDANDGWNADGSMARDYNRVPFSDFAFTDSDGNSWSPYQPLNSPWEFKQKKRFQPLLENNDYGYVNSQMHVTPHIGATARFYGFNTTDDEAEWASRTLSAPSYKYKDDARVVIDESRLTATDELRQSTIKFFDNKFTSLIPLKAAYFLRDLVSDSPLDFYKLTLEVQLSIYNGVVLTWKEKVKHDLPRPPSVVREELGDELVEAYAGSGQGIRSIKASEWEPFIRTMPHSEYPSGSACMCQVFAEQMISFAGSDEISPPLDFPIGPDNVLAFGSWSEISQACSDSRLWGGLHFPGAILAGAELCGGFFVSNSVSAILSRLIAGDETAAVLKENPGELKVRAF